MKCPKCRFNNSEDAKFCNGCGQKLGIDCPHCGKVNPAGSRFCNDCSHALKETEQTRLLDTSRPQAYTPKHLADKILTHRSAIEGERKLVTVLFADVVDSTKNFESLDPEDVHQIMDGCFRILLDIVHGYEGTINQFRGDGIMAIFGAPIAHEDHAHRACYAALSMMKGIREYGNTPKTEHNMDFRMRIGINSGHVVVGSIGDDLRMDYTADGDTTNLASRMESHAKPGTVVVTANTHRFVRDFFEFQSLGKVEVKGKEEPQDAFELTKAFEDVTSIDAAHAKGLTKWVGRKNSMATLMEVYERVKAGSGQVVGMVGEAGVGKSRLLSEFTKLLPRGTFTCLEGRCRHFGRSISYLPVLDILRSYFGIEDGDQEKIIKQKMVQKVQVFHERFKTGIPAFQDLLAQEVDSEGYSKLGAEQKRESIFEALRDLFIQISQEKPLLLVAEDLHWIDKTSEDFINYLIGWLANTRIMLLILYRPEYTHPWGGRSYYTQLGLNQLGLDSRAELLQALFQDGECSPELSELILKRASGNPFFIEEFTYNLHEKGCIEKKAGKYVLNLDVSDIQVPDTIQGVIAARLDRLNDDVKRTMQVASVIGRDFLFCILQTIHNMQEELKAHLLTLQSVEFIYEKSLFPELEYVFKHALTQEVAYKSLLNARRKELHRQVGKAMESIFSQRLAEYYGIIGEHYLRGEAWEQAFFYLEKAGEAAARLFAHAEARTHFSRAMKALGHLEDIEDNRRRRVDTIVNQISASWRSDSPEQNLKRLNEAEGLAKGLSGHDGTPGGDPIRLARVHFWMGRVHYSRGEMSEAMRYFQQMLPVAKKSDDPQLLAVPSLAIGQTMAVQGHLKKGAALLEPAISFFEETGSWQEWIQAKSFFGSALAGMGRYADGITQIENALARAKDIDFFTGVSVSNNCLGFAHLFGSDFSRAREAGEEAVKAAEISGDRIYVYIGYGIWAWAAGRGGELEAADACMRRSQEVSRELGGQVIMADLFTAVRAEIALTMRRFEEALTLAREGVDIAHNTGCIWGEGIARRVWSETLTSQKPPRWDEAETQIAESLRVLRSGKNRLEMARTHVEWGRLCRKRGNPTGAREHWEKAAEQYKLSGIGHELEQVRHWIEAL